MDPLEHQWPEVARALASLTSERQRQVATQVTTIALEAVDELAPEGDERAVTAEIERLDAIAWDLQDDGAAAPGAYAIAFRRARARTPWRGSVASSGHLNEALHALGAPPDAAFISEPVSICFDTTLEDVAQAAHTAGTMAAMTGATLAELMARLGHATPRAALRYQHAAEGRDAQIAKALSAMVNDARRPL